jgi:hypothetical protein
LDEIQDLNNLSNQEKEERKLEETFINHVEQIAEFSPDSEQWEIQIDRLIRFISKLPQITNSRKKVSIEFQEDYEDYDEGFNDILLKVRNEICISFYPTGYLAIRSLESWIKRKLRLRYLQYDIYRNRQREPKKISRDDESEVIRDKLEFDEWKQQPTLEGLEKIIEAEQEVEQQRKRSNLSSFKEYVDSDPDGILKNKVVPGATTCNYQILIQRLVLQIPPESLTKIADEFGIDYNALVAHRNRHFYPTVQCLYLEVPGLLTEQEIELIRPTIQADSDGCLQQVWISRRQPKMNAQFLAMHRLPMFCHPPLSFANIIELPTIREYRLSAESVEAFWARRCRIALGKLARQILEYRI